ncbi:alpha/beta hydrolase [Salinibacterium soli]|uniref:Alpha/beta hydrolase n=1 Tax=Antiquaquibacter soli TaxID=3064523 RepID=A0ABT9BR73_9MICO|nr:alpha/beta hydrolase [Protaetiibacter sp. WY-16]MDO7882938.1 alpha/beta hydrolase [Protaetiibacter sp. WY-16]
MKRTPIVAAAAALLLLLSGCQYLPSLSGAPTPSATPLASFEEYYAQEVSWSPCEAGMECARVEAPVSWDDPSLGSIELAVIRSQATGARQGSLFVNPGGPGGSGVEYVMYSSFPGLEAAFDIVGWDPRGVGRSAPVTCYTDDADRDESLYGTFDSPYDTEGWIEELTENTEDYAAACLKNTGELLAHIDTVSTAKDLDLLRAVVGDEKLNYLGYSYGTKIGATYAELFPENVGRMVLDGAVDPSLSDFEGLKTQMAGFESAFRAYMAYCLSTDACPFDGNVDSALAQAKELIATAGAKRLVADDGRVLDEATIATGIAINLYSEGYWPDMTDMFVDLRADDPNSTFTNADYYNSRNSDGSYTGNSVDAYQAVTCADGDFLDDPESTLDRVAEIDAAAPTIGKFFTYDDFAVLDVLCTHWPVPVSSPPAEYDAEGAPPILVIGTSNDPATPYAWAVSLADQLSSGVLISYEGEGHTIYNQGVACVDDVVDAYFVRGEVPAADPKC